jgi:hypothetical protein
VLHFKLESADTIRDRSQQQTFLRKEKESLLRSHQADPVLAGCIESLAFLASSSRTQTPNLENLPPKTQATVKKVTDLLIQIEQAEHESVKALDHSYYTFSSQRESSSYVDQCVEKALTVSRNADILEKQIKTLPLQTQRSLKPLIDYSIQKSDQTAQTLSPLVIDHINNTLGN